MTTLILFDVNRFIWIPIWVDLEGIIMDEMLTLLIKEDTKGKGGSSNSDDYEVEEFSF